jgi:predicted 2-oxoglutarate/Fe(II)-dependent dioxygenase YbiX
MDLNLKNYVLKINNFIEDNLCKKIIFELKKCNWKQHSFYNETKDEYKPISGEQELESTLAENMKYHDFLIKKIWKAIEKYMNTINFPWYSSWNGYTTLKFNKYSKNKKMAEHCDHIHDIFPGKPRGIPVLSVVGLLNENYKGGNFIMFKNKKINLKSGDLIIFPSVFLYPHKVTPVTKGTRYSYVSWVY